MLFLHCCLQQFMLAQGPFVVFLGTGGTVAV